MNKPKENHKASEQSGALFDWRENELEVKINREIRDYQESIFFGLNLRQLVFSVLAIGVAVGIYFGLNNILGRLFLLFTIILICTGPLMV